MDPTDLPSTRNSLEAFLNGGPSEPSVSKPQVPPPNAAMLHFLGAQQATPPPAPAQEPQFSSIASPPTAYPAHLDSLVTALISLVGRIRQELEENLNRLMALNPSRRESVSSYLDGLAGLTPGPSQSPGFGDPSGGLRRWVEGPRTGAQTQAMRIFLEEVALVSLGQALLLKAWSDRGVRVFRREDLSTLNWSLSSALKPFLPMDREGWQITRPNHYSWYNPGLAIQQEIWDSVELASLREEGPGLLAHLLSQAHQYKPATPEYSGYDQRFLSSLWNLLPQFGFQADAELNGLRRKKSVFCPTLRDGSLVRSGPRNLNWIGLEGSSFQLIIAELAQLWWGPTPPPLWSIGNGLEVHSRDQLSFSLGSPKPSLISRIAEMEACELGFVLEERCIRLGGRQSETLKFKEQLDSLPFYKNIKAPGTSLGDLQACVTLSKLRPGGLLWWAREESLSTTDGAPVLAHLLQNAKLVCEWDLSGVGHSLPTPAPLFPKYLYLFEKEPEIAQALAHRPQRVRVQGQIRSHIEVPLLLGDALARSEHTRGSQWQLHVHQSPMCQKEWIEHWPQAADAQLLQSLERLTHDSRPLASLTTVKATPSVDFKKEPGWSITPALQGFWFRPEYHGETRRIVTEELPRLAHPAKGSGYLVLVPEASWISPLRMILESEAIRQWLEHHGERKGEKWNLSEQIAKFIPIPISILQSLGAHPGGANQLTTEWEDHLKEIRTYPRQVTEKIRRLPRDQNRQAIAAVAFVHAAHAIEEIRKKRVKLLSLVNERGEIRWRDLLEILPQSELISFAAHPSLTLTGSLPPHVPVGRFVQAKSPTPGILFTTESGFQMHVGSHSPRLLEMIWSALENLLHPTWSELAQFIKLPRQVELAEATATDILRSHGEHTAKLKALGELVNICLEL